MIWVTGCFWQKPVVVDEVYAKKGIRLIAVMPIKGKAADENMVRLMRGKILEALYFKGYPKIPLELIDEKLAKTYDKSAGRSADISPQAVKSLLNVDALFMSISKNARHRRLFFTRRLGVGDLRIAQRQYRRNPLEEPISGRG